MSIWDEWREAYRVTSYEDQLQFYAEVGAQYPNQHFYNLPAIVSFAKRANPKRVFEVGGWRGELAADILPKVRSIIEWRNYEISSFAVNGSILGAPYRAEVPSGWIWDYPPFTGFDTAILAHVVEHMLADEFERLLKKLPDVLHLFIQSPLWREPRDWAGYEGTHIIEIGWDDLIRRVTRLGFVASHISIDGPENDRFVVFHRQP